MNIVQWIIVIICICGIIIASIGLIDSFTIEDVGIEKVPCLDRFGRPFENELCNKTITCSWLAFMGNADYKCSNKDAYVLLDETGGKDGR